MKINKVDILNEDKSVSFGGQEYPKFGWCVIVCGGSGSGKSSVIKNLIHIQAKTLDVDDIKKTVLSKSEINGDKLILPNGKEYSLDGISEPYDMSNPEYTAFIHKITKPLARSKKDTFFNSLVSDNKDRLPNVMFDITGAHIDDFDYIIHTLKPLGYKISVVWVLAGLGTALYRNSKRDRVVPENIVVDKYFSVLGTVSSIFGDKSFLNQVDDVWVVLNDAEFNPDDKESVYDYRKLPNVYHVKSKEDVLKLPNRIASAINRARKEVIKYK